ncbi:MAG: hypothetical protein DHS20C18_04130 [Saprospiraceae bacterium]|nr:MAG: hypothetical protein DHS20C18_04130 [Saprospiraceae bacterium]
MDGNDKHQPSATDPILKRFFFLSDGDIEEKTISDHEPNHRSNDQKNLSYKEVLVQNHKLVADNTKSSHNGKKSWTFLIAFKIYQNVPPVEQTAINV